MRLSLTLKSSFGEISGYLKWIWRGGMTEYEIIYILKQKINIYESANVFIVQIIFKK